MRHTVAKDYTVQGVAHALRTNFSDSDLTKRDQRTVTHGFWGEDDGAEVEDDDPEATLAEDELNAEGFAVWQEAKTSAEEALAVIQHARRTLREARAKQHDTPLSRQYFLHGVAKEKARPPDPEAHTRLGTIARWCP